MSGYVHGPEGGARVLALSPQLLSYLPGFPESQWTQSKWQKLSSIVQTLKFGGYLAL